ncbi:MAG TPA: amidohydrolase family protein [Pseudonocardia sp.]|uniref:amidohydrolase family protein n=1 Tax=Pseudonocardia sp. TaxID=60912 RepID=UPI002BF434C3|nr:amidohydrolase family protein [Pseudonocardia sp.]HTF49735.1 amidohydrolase family protein [Pseudonocardia sp.]
MTAETTEASRAMDTEASRPLEDVFVLDSTVHGYNTLEDNFVPGPYRERVAETLSNMLYGGHANIVPDGDPKWLLPRERFRRGHDPELLGRALFEESDTDMCVYHGTPLYGIFRDGGSPLSVGRAMRERWPGRVELYGPISPWEPGSLEEAERLVTEDKVVGIKMYPMDIVKGEIHSYRLDDPEIAFPILEKIQQLGVKVVATHKALPQGQVPSEPFAPWDVAGAASAFPDLTFEIVHGGLAYLEETAFQIARFPNVAVNLENSSAFLMARQPARFAHLLGQLLFWGGQDRIFWSSGATARHPQPFLEMFWRFEIPKQMQEEYGYPELTPEIKEKILGLNHAWLLGWDVAALRTKLSTDSIGMRKQLTAPWSAA